MEMTRRGFLSLLIVAPIAAGLQIKQNSYHRERELALARFRVIMKEAMEHWHREIDKQLMYGIPYHHSDASTGTWLGLERGS